MLNTRHVAFTYFIFSYSLGARRVRAWRYRYSKRPYESHSIYEMRKTDKRTEML